MNHLLAGLLKEKMTLRKNNFNQENLMAGFVVGLAAGAAGMYLFGTDDGVKLRKELKKHWQEASADLLSDGVIEHAEQDLWSIFKETLDKASQEITSHKTSPKNPTSDKKKQANSAVRKLKAKKTKNRFKGV